VAASGGKHATEADRVALVAKMQDCGIGIPAPAASGGGEGEPVAWGVVEHRGGPIIVATPDEDEANQYAGTVVPLYRAPPQPRGWLTEEEREAVEFLASLDAPPCVAEARQSARIGKDLLARSSPPEVVKPQGLGGPKLDQETTIQRRDRQWTKAIAAAGGAVKEVQ
jgi:hypothetical protein